MSLTEHLSSLVEDASEGLSPRMVKRRMFGCDAFFARETIYSIIWKEGRIALKLPPAEDEALLALPGARTWTVGKKSMSGWALVPEELHDDVDALRTWVTKAHAQARTAPPKPKKKTAKKTTKKTTKKKKTR